MSYTQSLYVNANIGNDTTGTGTQALPVATIAKALTLLDSTLSPIIYLDTGIYNITSLQSLSKTGKSITMKGKGLRTTITVNGVSNTPYVGTLLEVIDCIITPVSSFGGDTRVLSYSTDAITVNFRNVVFLKNGTYPTQQWFFMDGASSNVVKNKNFYNCLFVGSIPVNSVTGAFTVTNCATTHTIYATSYVTNTNSVVSVIHDSKYKLTNYDNITYGVYSGNILYTWKNDIYLFYSSVDSKYYTIDVSSNVVQFTPTDADSIFANGFQISQLTNTVLNSQALKNISPFKIRVFGNGGVDKTSLQLNAQKTTSELIVSTNDISTLVASTIDKFMLTNTVVGSGNVKIAVSGDGKATWKTWNGTAWQTLTYKESDGNLFRDEINSVGMTPDTLSSANVSTINTNNTFNFAYVLNKPLYSDDIIINKLTLIYNSKVHYTKLENKDIKVDVSEDYIKFTPARAITKVKANIMV